MNPKDLVKCKDFPCEDVNHEAFMVPNIEVDPRKVSLVVISEAAPPEAADYYYAGPDASFEQTTLQAFKAAKPEIASFEELIDLGVYCTSAVKCGKTGYGIKTGTVNECSILLQQELDLFPNVKVFLLMGDVAIKGLNAIARRIGENRVIPAGSTYKIRGQVYTFKGARVFPSYLQVGPSFGIEKSKQRMIAEDISVAMDLLEKA